jgi:hypothetical protein
MKVETSAITVTLRCLTGGNVHLQCTETPATVRDALQRLDYLATRNLVRPEDANRALDCLEAWSFSTSRRDRQKGIAAETNVGCEMLTLTWYPWRYPEPSLLPADFR